MMTVYMGPSGIYSLEARVDLVVVVFVYDQCLHIISKCVVLVNE